MTDDAPTPELLDEDDERYFEELRSMSDEEMLAHTSQMRDNLLADGGKLARELGITDEYMETLENSIAKFERAVIDEQIANTRLAEAARQMNASADAYLKALDEHSEYPQILDDDSKDSNKKGH
jgi:hypothetical protein